MDVQVLHPRYLTGGAKVDFHSQGSLGAGKRLVSIKPWNPIGLIPLKNPNQKRQPGHLRQIDR